jgi:hypothetical protein
MNFNFWLFSYFIFYIAAASNFYRRLYIISYFSIFFWTVWFRALYVIINFSYKGIFRDRDGGRRILYYILFSDTLISVQFYFWRSGIIYYLYISFILYSAI